jgi:hypothetical protein
MASRKEEKERLRAQRLEAERHEADAARRRLILGYVAAGLIGIVVVAGVVFAIAGSGGGEPDEGDFDPNAHIDFSSRGSVHGVEVDGREGTPLPAVQQANLEIAAREAGCELRLDLPGEGETHVDEPTVNYDTNPPTSGNHNPVWQTDGAYAEMPDPVNFVHSLEHGRVEIHYSPKLPERDQLALKGLFDASPSGILMFPNPDMPYAVAATAWQQLMGCDTYEGQVTLDALLDFRDRYRGAGPEDFGFTP